MGPKVAHKLETKWARAAGAPRPLREHALSTSAMEETRTPPSTHTDGASARSASAFFSPEAPDAILENSQTPPAQFWACWRSNTSAARVKWCWGARAGHRLHRVIQRSGRHPAPRPTRKVHNHPIRHPQPQVARHPEPWRVSHRLAVHASLALAAGVPPGPGVQHMGLDVAWLYGQDSSDLKEFDKHPLRCLRCFEPEDKRGY